ncbi:tRNA pseudouridine(55) synthase TruB, partial [Singulisphaera rosea]
MRPTLCGLLNLDKPSGMTSRAALDFVARPLRGNKVGHAGTLDPLASG